MAPRGTRGGRRQGTPGKAYSNRSDLAQNYAPQTPTTTAAQGGYQAPNATPPDQSPAGTAAPTQGGAPVVPMVSPSEVTPLDAPTNRPNEPVTAGLPSGAGPGPDPLAGHQDLLAMKVHLPYLMALTQNPDTPASVVNFVNYLSSQVGRA